MSNAVFPVLPGLAWNVVRSPGFNTKTFRSVNGKEVRAAFMGYPLWSFTQTFDVLRKGRGLAELEQLAGFFMARQGSFDSFLFNDPDFNSVTDQEFGVGDGVTTQFQLVRVIGGFVEPVQNVNVLAGIKDAGVATAAYTVSSGLVTFTTAPLAGHSLTWSGTYYTRCRFLQDMADFNQFMHGLYELKSLKMVGSPGNKV